MKALLVGLSQNEIFSEGCPQVKPDGIFRILTITQGPQGWTRGDNDQAEEQKKIKNTFEHLRKKWKDRKVGEENDTQAGMIRNP